MQCRNQAKEHTGGNWPTYTRELDMLATGYVVTSEIHNCQLEKSAPLFDLLFDLSYIFIYIGRDNEQAYDALRRRGC